MDHQISHFRPEKDVTVQTYLKDLKILKPVLSIEPREFQTKGQIKAN